MKLAAVIETLEGRDEVAQRQLFRVLVNYPHEEVIEAASAAGLEAALLAVCGQLEGKAGKAVLPSEVRQLIEDAVGTTKLLCYSDAARRVRERIDQWRSTFQASTAF